MISSTVRDAREINTLIETVEKFAIEMGAAVSPTPF
jgi:hypothetical protein